MSVLVIGHQNPDTDAVCSAIAYADLLAQTHYPDAVAAMCGTPNARTDFVLKTAGLPPPVLVMDVRPTAASISRKKILLAHESEPFFEVYRRMREHRLKAVPVVSDEGKVVGMLSLLNILQLLLPSEGDPAGDRFVDTCLSRICDVLKGELIHDVDASREERLVMMIGAMSVEQFSKKLKNWDARQIILVTGDREDVHQVALDYGVRCLVVTGGCRLDAGLLEKAKENAVSVLYSPHDTTRSALLIKSARAITPIIDRSFLSFPGSALVREILGRVQHEEQHLYPVVDGEGFLTGVFTKSDLIKPETTELILVDHNEFGQAVRGVEDARILEVVDHHRLGGGLSTREPIRFINEPVGSTCTIIARMFREKALMPRPPIALCLVAGIVSDTLNLTSPTTTDVDRSMLRWLEPVCGVKLSGFIPDLFSKGSTLQTRDAEGVLMGDCKVYEVSGWSFAVAQVEELGLQGFWPRKDELAQELERYVHRKGLHFACLMITDITTHESLLMISDCDVLASVMGFPEVEARLFKISGVVSRKKQLLPHLMQILSRISSVTAEPSALVE